MNNVNQGCGCGCTGNTPNFEKPKTEDKPSFENLSVVKQENKSGDTACCEPTKSPIWMSIVLYSTIAVAIGLLVYKLVV